MCEMKYYIYVCKFQNKKKPSLQGMHPFWKMIEIQNTTLLKQKVNFPNILNSWDLISELCFILCGVKLSCTFTIFKLYYIYGTLYLTEMANEAGISTTLRIRCHFAQDKLWLVLGVYIHLMDGCKCIVEVTSTQG